MKTSTVDLLKRLDQTEFFHAVGQPFSDKIKERIEPITSWQEAMQYSTSIEWDNYTLEQRNLLTMFLGTEHQQRFQKWNESAREVRNLAVPIAKKAATVFNQFNLDVRTKMFHCVNWAIMAACMELEYADLRKPDFFGWLIEFYLLGRYPCGWGERTKNGKIVLYGPLDESHYDSVETSPEKLVVAELSRLIFPQIRMPRVGKLLVF
jgi:hypothetical protein